ncbi:MAG: hypothetical protein M1834_001856 [Cirrosporium novae-zelandiae]|nr:MAG: hypothetical protein M1834_001856 [Cirrosporium novae-zelandiae]
MQRKFNYPTRASFYKMTSDDAWEIVKYMVQLEFPKVMRVALQFALFRTYAIPSISSLLVHTSQFSCPMKAPKRYADTSVLISEFMSSPPTHERTLEAIARMNYLHSAYQKSGKISNDDMLYTLSLFAMEPIKWVTKCEWRDMNEMERCALGTYWKEIGDAMEILYEALPSSEEGWIDGLHWLEEIWDWSEKYEEKYMVPHENNRQTADETTNILLFPVPELLKPFGKSCVSALLDNRLRTAMIYTPPTFLAKTFILGFLNARMFFLRYLTFPRPDFMRVLSVSASSSDGKYFIRTYDGLPFYVEPTFLNCWGPKAWVMRLMGMPVPGEERRFESEGYVIGEVGPENARGKGKLWQRQTVEKLRKTKRRGCPFGTMEG